MSSAEARWLVIAAATIGGLVIGSFLNVVVYRAPRRLSVVRPGSFCPHCSTPVRAFDNVPVVSWLLLGGRCRSCRAPISPRYPLVEAGTGLLFALVAATVGPHPAVVGLCAASAGVAASLAIELDDQPLPPAVPVVAAGIGLAALAVASGLDRHFAHLAGAAVGTLAGLVVARTVSRDGTWALVPAGMVIGWSEPIGAVVGSALVVVSVLALGLVTRERAFGAATRHPDRDRPAAATRVGPAMIAMTAAASAVVAALAAGTGLS